jgi:UDP-N-acetylmuramoyl-L-alanyl-D-glutamate--2,6-diaminopimelate ligase
MKHLLRSLIPRQVINLYHHLRALAAVAYYGYPAKHLIVIGVTGTDGKTTTSTILYHLLKKAGKKVALISTVGAFLGADATDLGFHVTTPDTWHLQKLIKRVKDEGYTHLVLEATSHGLDQGRLLGTNRQYALITNITPEHLDYHPTFKDYVTAKAKVFRHAHTVVLNQDDPATAALAKTIPHKRLYLVSLSDADPLTHTIEAAYPENYNRSNALLAVTCARALGVSHQSLIKAFTDLPAIEGRMQVIPNQLGINLIVDFAHTPNGLTQALSSVKPKTQGKLIAVYGAAGLRDYHKRPIMGRIGVEHADLVIFTAEDPRTENVHAIIYQMKQGIDQGMEKVISIANREEAITFAISQASAGDTVIILGKGHEKSMNLDGKSEEPWSDVAVARKILTSL